MATDDDLRRLALALPDTVERPSYGAPAFRVADRLFARLRDDDLVVVFVADLEEKEALLASDPEVFTTTPHYDGHPTVLVRLGVVGVDELGELLTDAWLLKAGKRRAAAFLTARDLPGGG